MSHPLVKQALSNDILIDMLYQLLIFNGRAFLLLLACFLVLRIIGGSAANRHLLLAVAIGAILMLPLSAQFMPAFDVTIRVSDIPISNVLPSVITGDNVTLKSPGSDTSLILLCLISFYLAGTILFLSKVICSNLDIFRTARKSNQYSNRRWSRATAKYCKVKGIKRPVTIRHSQYISAPMTWGFLRPVILLPSEALHWPDALLKSTLQHELAHIQRYDWLTQQIARCICALCWINPLSWRALHKLRAYAEAACDDIALNSGLKKTRYASALVNVAEHANHYENLAALSMATAAKRSHLTHRIAAILNPWEQRTPNSKSRISFTFALVFGFILPFASLRANYVETVQVVVSEPAHQIDLESLDSVIEDELIFVDMEPTADSPSPPTGEKGITPISELKQAPPPLIQTHKHELSTSELIEIAKNSFVNKITDIKGELQNTAQANIQAKPLQQAAESANTETRDVAIAVDNEDEILIADDFGPDTQTEHIATEVIVEQHSAKQAVVPKYPHRAQYRGIEGAVTVQYSIDRHGRVTNPKIIEANPRGVFNKSVIRALRKSTFNPRKIDGVPVTVNGLKERYVFLLKS